jgi:OmpA-OmpF porin, OOP family
LLTLGLLVHTASAQEPLPVPTTGLDAHGFHLAAHDGDVRDPLSIQRPGAFDQGDWFASGLAEYAYAPLVYEIASDRGAEARPIVDNLTTLNVAVGVALHERLRLDLLAPFYALSTGADGGILGPATGDLRATMMVMALRPTSATDAGGFGLGFHGHIDAPTGSPARQLGLGGLGGGGGVAATYEWEPATLTADVGVQVEPEVDLGLGTSRDALVAGLAVGWRVSETVGMTLEANSATPLVYTRGQGYGTLPPIETIASLRYVAPSGAFWTIGAAGGLTDGPGVAAFRAFVGGGFAKRTTGAPDVDTIGVLRATDLCPLEPETYNGWKDDDGCPDRLGTLGIEVKFRGESRSADAEITGADGLQSLRIGPQGLAVDAVPGSTWTVEATEGCLRGEATATAKEGGGSLVVELQPRYDATIAVEVVGATDQPLPGALVAWRSDTSDCVPPGTATADEQGKLLQEVSSGSHRLVVTASGHTVVEEAVDVAPGTNPTVRVKLAASKIVVDARQIRILEKVQFDSGKATIRKESHGLLDEVATVIASAPQIGRVEVAGHTDNKGPSDFNKRLSTDRAHAVRDYLVKQGVPAERLVAKGYGEAKPIDTNKTEQGRVVNRRVEFNLIDAAEAEEQ